jgi:hypothetical protein
MAAIAFEKEVLQRLTAIETNLSNNNFNPERCAIHDEKLKVANKRILNLERQQGKQNVISATIGGVGAGLALLVKYLFTREGA